MNCPICNKTLKFSSENHEPDPFDTLYYCDTPAPHGIKTLFPIYHYQKYLSDPPETYAQIDNFLIQWYHEKLDNKYAISKLNSFNDINDKISYGFTSDVILEIEGAEDKIINKITKLLAFT